MRRTFTDRVFAQVGVQTGDGRLITPTALTLPTPAPLGWAAEDWGAHAGAVTLPGAIEAWRVDGDNVLASGWLDDEQPFGADVARLVDQGVPLGVSLDLDDVTVEIVDTLFDEHGDPLDELRLASAHRGTVRFGAYSFRLGGSPLAAQTRRAQTAAAGDPDVPDGDIWWTFSSDEILERLVAGRARRATLVDTPAFAAAQFGLDGAGTADDTAASDEGAEPEAQAASAGTRERIVVRPLPETEQPMAPDVVAGIAATITAAATAPSVPVSPPRAWFERPEPAEPTPLHVGDDGQVYGHVWTTGCHTGSRPGQCLRAPANFSPGFPWFHVGYLVTAEGDRVAVGALTIGGGHADEELNITAARQHYDDVATVWADVVVTAGRHGGWACGAARPGLSPTQLRAIRAAPPSYDFRGSGGRSELIAVHQVVHPGHPVARFDRNGAPLAIVAAGLPPSSSGLPSASHAELMLLGDALDALRQEVMAPARARLRSAGTARARRRLRSMR